MEIAETLSIREKLTGHKAEKLNITRSCPDPQESSRDTFYYNVSLSKLFKK
jgi:hypothetical protein